jgi:N-formylglutamate deformylase
MKPFDAVRGDSPLILSIPHAGTFIPPDIEASLNERGEAMADTDWHVDRLYDGLVPGASIIKANFHRYVIDANRGPNDQSLYPGQNTTGLCPVTDFDGEPIWREGEAPDADEIEDRRAQWHAPYHAAITEAIETALSRHGVAVLYDCHSIRSHIPYLFEGELPVLNIGTNSGASCCDALEEIVTNAATESGFPAVLNGRFKGGWTTRHYGKPESNVHAIQMEIAQRAYMVEAPPWDYDEEKAQKLRIVLKNLLSAIVRAAEKGEL